MTKRPASVRRNNVFGPSTSSIVSIRTTSTRSASMSAIKKQSQRDWLSRSIFQRKISGSRIKLLKTSSSGNIILIQSRDCSLTPTATWLLIASVSKSLRLIMPTDTTWSRYSSNKLWRSMKTHSWVKLAWAHWKGNKSKKDKNGASSSKNKRSYRSSMRMTSLSAKRLVCRPLTILKQSKWRRPWWWLKTAMLLQTQSKGSWALLKRRVSSRLSGR